MRVFIYIALSGMLTAHQQNSLHQHQPRKQLFNRMMGMGGMGGAFGGLGGGGGGNGAKAEGLPGLTGGGGGKTGGGMPDVAGMFGGGGAAVDNSGRGGCTKYKIIRSAFFSPHSSRCLASCSHPYQTLKHQADFFSFSPFFLP